MLPTVEAKHPGSFDICGNFAAYYVVTQCMPSLFCIDKFGVRKSDKLPPFKESRITDDSFSFVGRIYHNTKELSYLLQLKASQFSLPSPKYQKHRSCNFHIYILIFCESRKHLH